MCSIGPEFQSHVGDNAGLDLQFTESEIGKFDPAFQIGGLKQGGNKIVGPFAVGSGFDQQGFPFLWRHHPLQHEMRDQRRGDAHGNLNLGHPVTGAFDEGKCGLELAGGVGDFFSAIFLGLIHCTCIPAARLIGRGSFPIMFRHILPNVLSPVLVIATISLALAIIAEATLSYLGVGAPATQPSLGTLLRIGQEFLFAGEWWILFFPAITLLALALSVNLLGDWLRDALNPKLR